jgi:hypothetical protein
MKHTPRDETLCRRVYRQLTLEQMLQNPRIKMLEERLGTDADIANDCQSFADEHGDAVVIIDRHGRVLCYREPTQWGRQK